GGDQHTGGDTSPNPTSQPEVTEAGVWIVSLRDGALRKIGDGEGAQVSPSGDRIAYVAKTKKQVMVAETAGTAAPHAIISSSGTRHTLRWSPDGIKLAFVSQRKEHAFIGIYDFATRSIRYVDPSVDRDSFPTWSPDSKQI